MRRPIPVTFWGDCWRRGLDHVGMSLNNEVRERGRALAYGGCVHDISVSGCTLSGIVDDNGQRYQASVSVRYVTKKVIDSYLKQLKWSVRQLHDVRQHGEWNELPDALHIAHHIGLNLFPTLWYNTQYSCNCGQRYWNSPCVHGYALLYAFGREIDGDPTLLFELYGFYLRYAVNKTGLGPMRAYYESVVPMLEQQLQLRVQPVNEHVSPRVVETKGFPNMTETLLRLMPERPLFDPGFKPLYTSTFLRTQRALQRLVDGKRQPRRLFTKAKTPMAAAHSTVMTANLFNDAWQTYALTAFITPWEQVPEASITFQVHYYAFWSAVNLLLTGGVAPKMVSDDNYHFYVVWLPTEVHPSARQVLRELTDLTPQNMVRYTDDDGHMRYVDDRARWLVGQYATMLVDLLAPHDRQGTYQDVFFHGRKVYLRYSYNRKVMYELNGFVAPLWIGTPSFRPYFIVEETEEEGRFLVQPAVVMPDQPDQPPVPMPRLLSERPPEQTDEARFFFYRFHEIIPDIEMASFNHDCVPLEFDSNRLVRFLDEVVPILQQVGVQVLLPKGMQELLRPRLSLRLRRNMEDEESSISIEDLLSYDWVLAVGEEQVDASQFEQMLKQNNSLLRFKSQYILVRKEELSQYRDAILGGKLPVKGSLLATALAEDYDEHPVLLTAEAREVIRRATTLTPVPLPEGLQATLRPYQERGYSWLYRNMRLGFGSILADDMGLGKTLQAIALILKLKEEGRLEDRKALIVVPTSLLTNWQAEVARFAPSLSVSFYHGHDRSQQAFAADITLTTYGVARGDMEILNLYPWRLLVVDEAQNIKNAASQQARAIVNIKADCRIALSGTPVENRLAEFWSIMQFCNPGYLGSQRQFSARYARPIQVDKDEAIAERFRRITSPFLLRRLKTDKDIIADLPDKIEKNEYVSLLPSQAALYQAVVNEAMKTLSGLDTDDAHHLFKRKGIILQMILALKQVCNHPAQYLKNDDLRPELSGKTEHLLELVKSILDAGEKVLIFSQFKQMGEMLVRFIQERLGEEALFYHGGCTVEQRAELVRRFQEEPSDRVFVLSLKAAGTGLNLTAATHVIHYDLWWNPAVESQATDRAYRIGQHQNVIVHRFITHSTFEEKIDTLIQDKRRLADITVASGEGWIADLSDDELRELFDNY